MQRSYWTGMRARDIATKEVQWLFIAKVIESAVSEWASPVMVLTIMDESLQMCSDYQKLN